LLGPLKAAEALIKLEAREARLLGLDMPTKVAVTNPDGNGIPLETIRRVMERLDEKTVDVTPLVAPMRLEPARRGVQPFGRDTKRRCDAAASRTNRKVVLQIIEEK
jgi:hypothetical protein